MSLHGIRGVAGTASLGCRAQSGRGRHGRCRRVPGSAALVSARQAGQGMDCPGATWTTGRVLAGTARPGARGQIRHGQGWRGRHGKARPPRLGADWQARLRYTCLREASHGRAGVSRVGAFVLARQACQGRECCGGASGQCETGRGSARPGRLGVAVHVWVQPGPSCSARQGVSRRGRRGRARQG